MKINFIFIILICLFSSCKKLPSQKEVLESVRKQHYLFIRPLIISTDQDHTNATENKNDTNLINPKITELSIEIPLDSISEKDISISEKQISITIPPAIINIHSKILCEDLKNVLQSNTNKIDELKNALQDEATLIFSNLLKSQGFKNIKILFTSSKKMA